MGIRINSVGTSLEVVVVRGKQSVEHMKFTQTLLAEFVVWNKNPVNWWLFSV